MKPKQVCNKHGLSVKQVVQEFGVAKMTLYNWEPEKLDIVARGVRSLLREQGRFNELKF